VRGGRGIEAQIPKKQLLLVIRTVCGKEGSNVVYSKRRKGKGGRKEKV